MHELLEELKSPFKEKFKSEVDITEITRFSVNLHKNAAVVVTNSYIYLLTKKLFRTNLKKVPLEELLEVVFEDEKIEFTTNVESVGLPVATEKNSAVIKLANKIKDINKAL